MLRLNVERLKTHTRRSSAFRTAGKLHSAREILLVRLKAAVGELCELRLPGGDRCLGEVVGFDGELTQVMCYHSHDGLRPGLDVVGLQHSLRVPVGAELLGRVLDGMGTPIDGRGPLSSRERRTINGSPPDSLSRPPITTPFVTAQRVIDGLLTIGHGQRVGLFAGSGVGKSTLLGEIAKAAHSQVNPLRRGCSDSVRRGSPDPAESTTAGLPARRGDLSDSASGSDGRPATTVGATAAIAHTPVNVIALVGERGREVRPFLEENLGERGRERSVVVVATSDESPLMRVRAVGTAVTIAESFRDAGRHVLLMLDSLTRFAMAQREIGLLRGEPPGARGYPPSAIQMLSRTLERLGTSAEGSITGIINVLVDGDDLDEPVSDAARSILDGHIVLDRDLAARGHFPAVDVLRSVSRLFPNVVDAAHHAAAGKVRAMLSTHREVADLLQIGAYKPGSSPQVDRVLQLLPAVNRFLRQPIGTATAFEETRRDLLALADQWAEEEGAP